MVLERGPQGTEGFRGKSNARTRLGRGDHQLQQIYTDFLAAGSCNGSRIAPFILVSANVCRSSAA